LKPNIDLKSFEMHNMTKNSAVMSISTFQYPYHNIRVSVSHRQLTICGEKFTVYTTMSKF